MIISRKMWYASAIVIRTVELFSLSGLTLQNQMFQLARRLSNSFQLEQATSRLFFFLLHFGISQLFLSLFILWALHNLAVARGKTHFCLQRGRKERRLFPRKTTGFIIFFNCLFSP